MTQVTTHYGVKCEFYLFDSCRPSTASMSESRYFISFVSGGTYGLGTKNVDKLNKSKKIL